MTALMGESAPVPAGTQALPIWCDVCGARVELVLPVGIDALSAIAGAFEKRHARCGRSPDGADDDPPHVCPGCLAVGAERCAPGCIDAEIEEELERRDYDAERDEEDDDD